MIQNNIKQFASVYGSDTYGGNRYSASDTHQETDGGRLQDTGMDVVVGITGGVLLIAIAAVILVTTRRKRNKK